MRSAIFVLVIYLCCVIQPLTDAKVVQGHLKSPDNWVFLSKFCYDSDDAEVGLFGYTVSISPAFQNFELLIYFDDGNATFGWNAAYGSRLTCSEKEAMKSKFEHITPPAGSGLMEIISQYRPHWRYIVAADCSSTNGLEFDYTLNFTQATGSQFSLDDMGLLPLNIVYFVLFVIIGAIHVYGVFQLYQVELYHLVVKCLTMAVAAATLSALSNVLHFGIYASNGIGLPALRGFADLLSMMMDLSLMITVILLSKGYAVSVGELPRRDKIVSASLAGLLGLFYMLLFVWDFVGRDPAQSLYVYDSWPGYSILCIRLGALLWFVWTLYQTLRAETTREKRLFYTVFGCAFSMWFMFLPLAVLIGSLAPSWDRQKTALAVKTTLDFVSIAAMTILMWPSNARRYLMLAPTKPLLMAPSASSEQEQL